MHATVKLYYVQCYGGMIFKGESYGAVMYIKIEYSNSIFINFCSYLFSLFAEYFPH